MKKYLLSFLCITCFLHATNSINYKDQLRGACKSVLAGRYNEAQQLLAPLVGDNANPYLAECRLLSERHTTFLFWLLSYAPDLVFASIGGTLFNAGVVEGSESGVISLLLFLLIAKGIKGVDRRVWSYEQTAHNVLFILENEG